MNIKYDNTYKSTKPCGSFRWGFVFIVGRDKLFKKKKKVVRTNELPKVL